MRPWSIVLLISLITGPASACLNDSETASREQEFRSRYGNAPMVRALDSIGGGWVVLAVGAAAFGSALVVLWRRRG
jgi:hypothetical protein